MALVTDLTGLGTAPTLAGRLGHPTGTAVAGSGTTQAGTPTVINTTITLGLPVSSQTAYILVNNPTMMKEYYFFNQAVGATTALIYPPNDSGSTLNGSTSAAISVAQNKSAMFMCVSGSGVTGKAVWVALVSA